MKADSELDLFKRRLQTSEECRNNLFAALTKANEQNAALEAEVVALRNQVSRLRRYAYHDETCQSRTEHHLPLPCDCGLESLLERISCFHPSVAARSQHQQVTWEYLGEELALFWESPYGHGQEKIATFWWPAHPVEATKEVERLFEEIASRVTMPTVIAAQKAESQNAALEAEVVALREALENLRDSIGSNFNDPLRLLDYIDKVLSSSATAAAINPWKAAVLDAAVVNWTFTKEQEENPRLAINALLVQAQKEALDPRISKEAAAIKGKWQAEALKEAAKAASEQISVIDCADWLLSRAAELEQSAQKGGQDA